MTEIDTSGITLSLKNKVFDIVSEIAMEQNTDAYVIGGFVRDTLLGRECKDIDIVVIGNGIEIARKTAARIDKNIPVSVFKTFGTAMFRYNGMEIEFVGARRESYRQDSRKPTIENGSLEDDQNRRDFTINALAISLNKSSYGKLLDPFNGLKDLEDGIIRTPLDPINTFSDDPLRMIRAIRFATKLGFTIEDKTLSALRTERERIAIVSEERITDELNKILLTERPSTGFYLLDDCGLLEIIFPELALMKGIDTVNGRQHKDNFIHTLMVLDNLAQKSDNLWLRWAALMHDIGKPGTKRYEVIHGWTFHGHDFLGSKMLPEIFRRMRLPLNEKMKYVQKLVRLHLRPIALVQDVVTDSAVRRLLAEAEDDIDDLMLLCEADITSGIEDKVKKYLSNFKLVREKLKELEERDTIRNFQPPVTGEEIIATFNMKPSKEVGIIKATIKEAILEGTIRNNHDEAFAYMLIIAGEMGLIQK